MIMKEVYTRIEMKCEEVRETLIKIIESELISSNSFYVDIDYSIEEMILEVENELKVEEIIPYDFNLSEFINLTRGIRRDLYFMISDPLADYFEKKNFIPMLDVKRLTLDVYKKEEDVIYL